MRTPRISPPGGPRIRRLVTGRTAHTQPGTRELPAAHPTILVMSAVASPYPVTSTSRAAPWARRARVDAGVRAGALVLLWLGLLLVTYWWAAGGGLSDLTGWETGLTSLGRLSGLL